MAFTRAMILAFVLGAVAQPAHSMTRAEIDALVAGHAAANGVPVALVHRVIIRESRYNPRLVGKGGAMGLMHIKPAASATMAQPLDCSSRRPISLMRCAISRGHIVWRAAIMIARFLITRAAITTPPRGRVRPSRLWPHRARSPLLCCRLRGQRKPPGGSRCRRRRSLIQNATSIRSGLHKAGILIAALSLLRPSNQSCASASSSNARRMVRSRSRSPPLALGSSAAEAHCMAQRRRPDDECISMTPDLIRGQRRARCTGSCLGADAVLVRRPSFATRR
jgi:hypothetical protein